ncbi:hypothetical protein CONLIGDRAFT_687652 [Coniochaeta ligniaria NRRL 30616]|uniref:Uncharacterized protein n=1 Tax=Coniochaeta ligniaria NRRL 30616 TaxID=1408157 RepID=A0A1J7J4B1_9PEZI|nr:hypothetical protein CONLIGDRAFT_687652 [Coniochaeta ligniaria NRRL 30616]
MDLDDPTSPYSRGTPRRKINGANDTRNTTPTRLSGHYGNQLFPDGRSYFRRDFDRHVDNNCRLWYGLLPLRRRHHRRRGEDGKPDYLQVELTPVAMLAGRRPAARLFGPPEFSTVKLDFNGILSVVFAHQEALAAVPRLH